MTKRMTAQEKRALQYKENCEAIKIFDDAMKDFCKDFSVSDFYNSLWKCEEKIFSSHPSKPLRYCNAKVYESERFFLLRSYETIIAVIDRKTDTCVDVLRRTWGEYTATSAQHIAKFRHDFSSSKFGCKHNITWRSL